MSPSLIAALMATPIAFAAGNLYASNLASLPGEPITNLATAAVTLPGFVAKGGGFTGEPAGICVGVLLVCAVWIAWSYRLMAKGTRNGEEHGSARWATRAEMRAFGDAKAPDNNIILAKNARLALDRGRFDLKTDRNHNVVVVGGSGSGKTRYYVKPNLMQLNSSYFVTDPKGTLIGEMGHLFAEAGYEIRSFNTIDFAESNRYNPLRYVRSEADVLTFVECLIKNTTGDKDHAGDPFWENAERLLYTALVSYLLAHCPEEDRNLPGLLVLLGLAEAKEEDESYTSPLDILFAELETGKKLVKTGEAAEEDFESRAFSSGAGGFSWVRTGEPVPPEDDFSLSNYKAFKTAAGKTLKSIIISCNVRLKPLSIKEVSKLLERDEMGLDELGEEGKRTVVFASMPDTNSTFDFLFAILMWQTLDVLCNVALRRHAGHLPTHVHFILDEFANIGHVPDFERTIAVVRSRNISCSIILQSLAQLKSRYKDDAQTIQDCCDTTLFLGGKSGETNKEISEAVGKQTVSTITFNDSRGSSSSRTRNYNRQERDLIQPSEVGRLPRDEAIVLITGAFPFKDKKYPLERHPRYRHIDPGRPGARHAERFGFASYRIRQKEEA
ncbi:VirD4-like conjugal transfer protein, CD1115 family [Enteroscipio rubneri]|uniref:VirD4-like conjugal transfer protein, CD1115 family n=1 Tax=Enteroscipio rubneri TaxID=2070686 RepID=UPI003AB3B25B